MSTLFSDYLALEGKANGKGRRHKLISASERNNYGSRVGAMSHTNTSHLAYYRKLQASQKRQAKAIAKAKAIANQAKAKADRIRIAKAKSAPSILG